MGTHVHPWWIHVNVWQNQYSIVKQNKVKIKIFKKEREIKETIPFTIAMKRIKYLGIYLPKETKDLYIENYKHW